MELYFAKVYRNKNSPKNRCLTSNISCQNIQWSSIPPLNRTIKSSSLDAFLELDFQHIESKYLTQTWNFECRWLIIKLELDRVRILFSLFDYLIPLLSNCDFKSHLYFNQFWTFNLPPLSTRLCQYFQTIFSKYI